MARRAKSSLADIEKQIEALQQQASELRAAEVAGVIDRIKTAIAHYSLTAEQLGLTTSERSKTGRSAVGPAVEVRKKRMKRLKIPGIAKYSDGSGKTWTGNGKRPQWFLDAIASGKTAEDLLIAAK